MIMVGANRTRRLPSASSVSLTTEELEYALESGSTTSVTSKTALRSGSSQQGKARRASVDSIWVVAIVCVTRRVDVGAAVEAARAGR